MPYGNRGFDYLWDSVKIDNKGRCLYYSGVLNPILGYSIGYNNIAHKFILSGWDNRDDLNPLIVLEFDRDDIVRGRPFWKRYSLTITYTPEGLEQFEEYRIDIDWLKELRDKIKYEGCMYIN